MDAFAAQLKRMPIVAILRGIKPDDVVAVADAILDAGIGIVEVPLNSPEPFASISRLAKEIDEDVICGAGTVLSPQEVDRVAEAGGTLIVSPNCDPAVIRRTVKKNMLSLPGIVTPTEAFSAVNAGARTLKLFPGGPLGPDYIKNLKTVLPPNVQVLAVGGVGAHNMAEFWKTGCAGFGIGSELYRAGDTPDAVSEKALSLVAAVRKLQAVSATWV